MEDDELLLETREGMLRGGGAILFGVVFLLLPTIVLGVMAAEGGSPLPALGCGLLFLATVVRFPRGTLRFHPEHLEVTGPTGTRSIPYEEFTGLTCDWLSVGRPEAWTELLVLDSTRGKVRLDVWEDADAVWGQVYSRILPQLADRYLEALQKGDKVELGPIRLDPEGFELEGGLYYWDELDWVMLTKDGMLITIRERPHEAAVFKPSKCPAAIMLYPLQAALLEARGELDPEELESRPRRGQGRERPLPGMPSPHPELGEIVFTRSVPTWAKLLFWSLGAGILLLVAGGIAWGAGLRGPEPLAEGGWLIPGGGLLFLIVILFGVLDPPSGDEFTVYEGGMADPDRVLPWDQVDTLTLEATEHYTNGVYTHTNYDATASGGEISFGVQGFGAKAQAYWGWFRDKLAPILAQRDVERIAEGETVDYGFATMSSEGIFWEGGGLPWAEYHSKNAEQGWLYLFSRKKEQSVLSIALSQPNAHVFQLILNFMEFRAAEMAAEEAEAES